MREKQQERRPLNRTHESISQESETDVGTSDIRNGPKKKRKLGNVTEKKYACPQEGCDKSYSRAEHLYRHQLNRRPYLTGLPEL